MPCYNPQRAFRSRSKGETGKYGITFNATKALIEGSSFMLACGSCIGCRIDRTRDWAIRCYHESQMHRENMLITLTFDDEHLPADYGVHVRTWQLFMKRLRKSLHANLRFFACGEYGDQTLRPHYHALIFGYKYPDLVLYKRKRGNPMYTSKSLAKIWPFGIATIQDVNYASAGYVARYVMKKLNGDTEKVVDHYTRVHPLTGRINLVRKEFCVQSRKPGLGSTWFDKYKGDAFPSDFVIVNGKKHSVPKYYTKKLQEEEHAKIVKQRKLHARLNRSDNTPERLKVREQVKISQISRLKREL